MRLVFKIIIQRFQDGVFRLVRVAGGWAGGWAGDFQELPGPGKLMLHKWHRWGRVLRE